MPDWSYHPLKKVVLDHVSAKTSREFVHTSMRTIASIPGGSALIHFLGHMKPSHHLKKDISNTIYSSPVGLSSLIDPHLSGTAAFQHLGFGFIEIGPIVLNEPKKQCPPMLQDNHILYSHHQEKLPLRRALKRLAAIEPQIPILANIDRKINKEECAVIIQHLTPYVDAFIATREQIEYFNNDALPIPQAKAIYMSCSADEASSDEFIQFAKHAHIDGIVLYSPWHTMNNNCWHEAEHAQQLLAGIVRQMKRLRPELVVITSGGVATPDDAHALVQAGADLMMLTEGYVKAGPGLPKRIHERLLAEDPPSTKMTGWHWSLLFGLSILLGGIIALYFAFTTIILPYDELFIGLTRADLLQINPRILSFMSHDRMALAGTMISGGILYIQLARHGMKRDLHWAKIAFHSAAIIGFLGILLFIGYGYFDWLHGLFWLILLPIYYASYKEGKTVTAAPCSNHGSNDRAWQLANYGQLLFVILGFSIVVGGVVISTIGVSNVFVSTDISYLCMPPQMLNSINSKLIPVIAHDRAGFGSA